MKRTIVLSLVLASALLPPPKSQRSNQYAAARRLQLAACPDAAQRALNLRLLQDEPPTLRPRRHRRRHPHLRSRQRHRLPTHRDRLYQARPSQPLLAGRPCDRRWRRNWNRLWHRGLACRYYRLRAGMRHCVRQTNLQANLLSHGSAPRCHRRLTHRLLHRLLPLHRLQGPVAQTQSDRTQEHSHNA